jgi:hypothetical protein
VAWLVSMNMNKTLSKGLAIRAKFPTLWKEFLDTHPTENEIYKDLSYS